MTYQFHIPPIPWDVMGFTGLDLHDEGFDVGKIDGINFIGEKIQASIVAMPDGSQRGVVVAKSENPIDIDAPVASYFISSGNVTNPLNTGTTLNLSSYTSNDITLLTGSVSGAQVHSLGTYQMSIIVQGSTTSSICADDTEIFTYTPTIRHYRGASLISTTQGTLTPTWANCNIDNRMFSKAKMLTYLQINDHIEIDLYVEGSTSLPRANPSASGDFYFIMNRVSLGS